MNWKYIKELQSLDLISEFENTVNYKFCSEFVETVKNYNGARPENSLFDTDKTEKRAIKSLLSFNKSDKETVWKIMDWNRTELAEKYVAFGIDNFGNLICFSVENGNVIFLECESLSIEMIAGDFTGFLSKLYSE